MLYATTARKTIVAFLRGERRYVDAATVLAHVRGGAGNETLAIARRTGEGGRDLQRLRPRRRRGVLEHDGRAA